MVLYLAELDRKIIKIPGYVIIVFLIKY